jgi:hypothetical protein
MNPRLFQTKSTFILLAVAAVACEGFSLAAFHGLWAQAWPVCGSACEVWPGIMTGTICVLSCSTRNGMYIPLFWSGIVIASVDISLVIRSLLVPGRNTALEP